MSSGFPQISKQTANFFYYPGILIVVITHIVLLTNSSMLSQPNAVRMHAILNLIAAALIAVSWFGFSNTALGTML